MQIPDYAILRISQWLRTHPHHLALSNGLAGKKFGSCQVRLCQVRSGRLGPVTPFHKLIGLDWIGLEVNSGQVLSGLVQTSLGLPKACFTGPVFRGILSLISGSLFGHVAESVAGEYDVFVVPMWDENIWTQKLKVGMHVILTGQAG